MATVDAMAETNFAKFLELATPCLLDVDGTLSSLWRWFDRPYGAEMPFHRPDNSDHAAHFLPILSAIVLSVKEGDSSRKIFEFSERDVPLSRIPLWERVNELAKDTPELLTTNLDSIDGLESWFCVHWQPLRCFISTHHDLRGCFYVYYRIRPENVVDSPRNFVQTSVRALLKAFHPALASSAHGMVTTMSTSGISTFAGSSMGGGPAEEQHGSAGLSRGERWSSRSQGSAASGDRPPGDDSARADFEVENRSTSSLTDPSDRAGDEPEPDEDAGEGSKGSSESSENDDELERMSSNSFDRTDALLPAVARARSRSRQNSRSETESFDRAPALSFDSDDPQGAGASHDAVEKSASAVARMAIEHMLASENDFPSIAAAVAGSPRAGRWFDVSIASRASPVFRASPSGAHADAAENIVQRAAVPAGGKNEQELACLYGAQPAGAAPDASADGSTRREGETPSDAVTVGLPIVGCIPYRIRVSAWLQSPGKSAISLSRGARRGARGYRGNRGARRGADSRAPGHGRAGDNSSYRGTSAHHTLLNAALAAAKFVSENAFEHWDLSHAVAHDEDLAVVNCVSAPARQ